jgi:biotin synthase
MNVHGPIERAVTCITQGGYHLQRLRIDAKVESILDKALGGRAIEREEALQLLKIDETSPEMYALISAANMLTRRQYDDRGEVYGTIGINLWPCSKSCAFCSFGADWALVKSPTEFTLEEVVSRAKSLEDEGANAIFLMSTADYPIDRYIEISKAVRTAVSAKMPMVANIGDFGYEEAKELVEAGFQAVYHVHRLREGEDTGLDPAERLKTMKFARDAGLDLSYCVEPIGPEHTPEELATEMFRGKQLGAVNLACMWRVPVPELPLSKMGKISEATLAKDVAVARIVADDTIKAMGVHEPRTLPLFAGANQIYAHTAGFSPRRSHGAEEAVTEESKEKGYSVKECRSLLRDAGYLPLEGPTKVFQGNWPS